VIKTPSQRLSRNPSGAGYTNPLRSYSVPATDNPDGTINVPAQAVFGIDPNREPIDAYLATRQIPGGTPTRTYDATANDSDKTFTVPAGRMWQLEGIMVDFTTTATVGNRSMRFVIGDGTNILWLNVSSSNQAASLNYIYIGSPALTNAAVTATGIAQMNFPSMVIPEGYTIRVYDALAVDAAADDMIVSIIYIDLPA